MTLYAIRLSTCNDDRVWDWEVVRIHTTSGIEETLAEGTTTTVIDAEREAGVIRDQFRGRWRDA